MSRTTHHPRRLECARPLWADGLMALARTLLAMMFIVVGAYRLSHWSGAPHYFDGSALDAGLLTAAGVVEIVCGLALVLGAWTRVAAFALAVYLLPVTFSLHAFWLAHGAMREVQAAALLKNLAIIGGLCMFAVAGAGSISVDRLLRARAAQRAGLARAPELAPPR